MSTRRHRPKLCVACEERRAKFSYRGRVRADRDHVLCFQCHRAAMNRARARQLQPRLPFGSAAELTPGQAAHRERMLAHLGRSGSR
jgi:hypothetical protein